MGAMLISLIYLQMSKKWAKVEYLDLLMGKYTIFDLKPSSLRLKKLISWDFLFFQIPRSYIIAYNGSFPPS